ncbi:hypothetical protein [Gordonia sp. MP11Mi]|uniref:DUF998 domain-containing protein n=1 Tax=Gordonia sp. MP11Mi TaxID=3022769 RepID=A0AA97CVD3_9ACTN
MIVTPAQRWSAVIPIDAVILAAGALLTLGSYLLPWYSDVDRPTRQVTGLGRANDPALELHSARLNWMVAAAAIVALLLATRRLAGQVGASWRHAAAAVSALAAAGALFDFLTVPDGMTPAHGMVFASVGAGATAVGALLCRQRIGRLERRE